MSIRYTRRRVQGSTLPPPITPFEQQLATLYGSAVYRRFKFDEGSGVPDDTGTLNVNGLVQGSPVQGIAGVGLDTVDLGFSADGAGAYMNLQSPLVAIGTSGGHRTGALFLVCKIGSAQVQADNTLTGQGGTTSFHNRLELRLYSGGGGQPEFHWRSGAVDGTRTRRWTTADMRDNATHFWAIVQRRDGNGPRLFIDGVEQTTFADFTSGGSPPSLDAWGYDLDVAVGGSGYVGSSVFQESTHYTVGEFYHASSIGTAAPTDTIVSDAEILALANSIP